MSDTTRSSDMKGALTLGSLSPGNLAGLYNSTGFKSSSSSTDQHGHLLETSIDGFKKHLDRQVFPITVIGLEISLKGRS